MTVFAVIASTNPEAIRASIVQQYGANHFQFAANAWFIFDGGTTKDVSDKLSITSGALGAQAAVLRFDAYSGWASADAWKWIGIQAAANG